MLLSSLRSLTQNPDARWMLRRLAGSPHRASKLRNLMRVQWAKLRKDPTAGKGLPLIVSVEPTNSCNMKCPMCPTGLGVVQRTRGMMDLDRFAALVDQLQRTTMIMTFWGWGESTLHPDLYAMIETASSRGIVTMLTTNGTKFDVDALLDCGLDYMVVSFDGLRDESYRPVRVGGDLEFAMDGVRRLAEAKRHRGLDRPKVNMGFIVTRLNEMELPDLEATARAIGFDGVRPKYLHVVTEQVAKELRPNAPALRGEVGIVGPGRSIERDIPGVRRPTLVPNGCGILWEYAMIYWDGRVAPCCYDWDAQTPLGNAFDEDFATLWHGPAYAEFRQRVRTDKQSIALCRDCEGGDIMVFFSDTFLLNGRQNDHDQHGLGVPESAQAAVR